MTRNEITAQCGRCFETRSDCAVTYRLVNIIYSRWSSEPETLCLACRKGLHYKLDPQHEPVRLRPKKRRVMA